tara:strand:+ start:499 stop:642 length:144 start_codon:yes stop_codon:yes gene_type:complete
MTTYILPYLEAAFNQLTLIVTEIIKPFKPGGFTFFSLEPFMEGFRNA